MVLQGLFESEGFPALIADEGLRGFHPLVTLQVILERLLFSERSFALRTGEGPRDFTHLVTHNVILQRLLHQEASVTLVTSKRLFVNLHVFVQVTFEMETNVTVLAEKTLLCL